MCLVQFFTRGDLIVGGKKKVGELLKIEKGGLEKYSQMETKALGSPGRGVD